MQGFNKYYPPDYDPSQGSLNKARGKHALGDRARKIDQGILITRFELPFNIWCDTCHNHIGMGVRYNAEKKKIGAYYSTPIFSFRCKCHLCDGWFEIQTDPKNTRYVVVSGARQKDEDWNPEENGGFAIHDTERADAPVDPLVALEKKAVATKNMNEVQIPRLESLQSVSEQYNADPYSLSLKARKHFRQEKKVEQSKRKADDLIKDRYGLPTSLSLLEDDDEMVQEAKEKWMKGKEEIQRNQNLRSLRPRRLAMDRLSIPSSSSRRIAPQSKEQTLASLKARILDNTARKSYPFGGGQSIS